jgi:hypothetical protein
MIDEKARGIATQAWVMKAVCVCSCPVVYECMSDIHLKGNQQGKHLSLVKLVAGNGELNTYADMTTWPQTSSMILSSDRISLRCKQAARIVCLGLLCCH